MIDWANFTPVSAVAGGLLIGLAVALLIILNGRIAGVSGILSNLFTTTGHERNLRAAFLIGLIVSPIIFQLFHRLPSINQNASYLVLIIAGLMVGIGTHLAGGCTSGHGVCGLARLSLRSLIAVLFFMSSAMITVYITHHILS
jgi:uncharacterized membrane protein YedE/YeeE